MEEKKAPKPKVQNLILENREKLSVSGVLDVESFNEECIIADTELGVLIVRGIDLRINRLNLDNAELLVEGDIQCCEYGDQDNGRSKGGFFARMFR